MDIKLQDGIFASGPFQARNLALETILGRLLLLLLLLMLLLLLSCLCLFTLRSSGTHGSSMEVECSRRRCGTSSKLRKEILRVRTRGREHRPTAAGCQACSQRRLVGCGEAATDVMSVAEVVIGRPRQHGRTQWACPQRATAPGEGCNTSAGQKRRGRCQGSDRGKFGATWRLGWRSAKRLLKGIGLQAQGTGSRL